MTVLTVLAVAAHPDDIEFMMAGTLLLLRDAGADIHFWNLANGCYGSEVHPYEVIAALRWQEAQASAREAGASIYPPICDDMGIFYEKSLIARVAARVRQIQPDIILTHAPHDYMEDHMNACRLAVSGAFVRGMPNYISDPPAPAWSGETVIYHALPHGLRDQLRQLVEPEFVVDIASVLARKRSLLAKHESQKAWLDASQGMDSYLIAMEDMCRAVAKTAVVFEFAEGWRRHSHLGFASEAADPLRAALGDRCR